MRASKTQRAARIAAEKWASARGTSVADVPLSSRPRMLTDIAATTKLPASVVHNALLSEWNPRNEKFARRSAFPRTQSDARSPASRASTGTNPSRPQSPRSVPMTNTDPWALAADYVPAHHTTPQYVLDAIGKWADPESVDRATLEKRLTYENGGTIVFNGDGLPLNPNGPTGKSGRLLGKWGPNHAADPIVFRKNPGTGVLEMLAIQRKDTKQWAIPGGMCDAGEAISGTLARELKEETNVTLDMTDALPVYQGINDTDPRNTDHAWMETNVTLTVLDAATAERLDPIVPGDDAERVQWMPLSEDNINKLYSSHGDFVRQALALYTEAQG